MRSRARRPTTIAGVLAGVMLPALAHGRDYNFVRIADTGGGTYTFFGDGPSISNSGAIAFQAGTFDGAGIFRAEAGGGITPIATTSTNGFTSVGARPHIDRLGEMVAFDATTSNGTGAYRGSGAGLTTIAAPPAFTAFLGSPLIQPGGTGNVLFVAFTLADGTGIYRGDGNAPATLAAGAAHGFSEFGNNPGVNASGSLLLRAELDGVGDGVYIRSGAINTTLALVGPIYAGFAGSMALNDSGVAAFRATYTGGGSQAMLVGDGYGISAFIDTLGPYGAFTVPSINMRGRIIVRATLDAGGAALVRGPDPINDRIIGIGDVLDGSTVTNIAVHTGALNDSDQVAFRANLADGRSGIYRADPAACPADIVGVPHRVDIDDLLEVINGWGSCIAPCPPECAADIDDDCAVNINDLLTVINNWGDCP